MFNLFKPKSVSELAGSSGPSKPDTSRASFRMLADRGLPRVVSELIAFLFEKLPENGASRQEFRRRYLTDEEFVSSPKQVDLGRVWPGFAASMMRRSLMCTGSSQHPWCDECRRRIELVINIADAGFVNRIENANAAKQIDSSWLHSVPTGAGDRASECERALGIANRVVQAARFADATWLASDPARSAEAAFDAVLDAAARATHQANAIGKHWGYLHACTGAEEWVAAKGETFSAWAKEWAAANGCSDFSDQVAEHVELESRIHRSIVSAKGGDWCEDLPRVAVNAAAQIAAGKAAQIAELEREADDLLKLPDGGLVQPGEEKAAW